MVDERQGRAARWAAPALFTFIAALHLWSLMRYPAPFVDEAWLVSRAWGFVHTGHQFGALDTDAYTRFDGYWTVMPWLPTAVKSLVLRLWGLPALLPLRLLSLLFGMLLLYAVFVIARSLGGRRLALLTVFLVGLSPAFFYSAHLARQDIMAAALGLGALALHLVDQRGRWWVSFLSGLGIGLAFETHPYSAVYGPAILLLYLLRYRRAIWRQPALWGLGGGLAAGLGLYVVWHILPYPQTYFALSHLAFAQLQTPPLLTLDPRVMLQSASGLATLLLAVYQIALPLLVWAVLILARRQQNNARIILALGGGLVGAAVLLFRNGFYYYAILLTPALDLIIAAALLQLGRRPWRSRWDTLHRALAWGVCAAFVILTLSRLQQDQYALYAAAQQRVEQTVRPGDTILAPHVFWLDLYDHPYHTWEELVWYRRIVPGSTVTEAMREYRPDLVVMDAGWANFVADEPGESLLEQSLWLPRAELDAFLRDHATQVDHFDSVVYGPLSIYRISWER